MTVASILKQKGGDVVSVQPDQTIADVVRVLAEAHIGAVLVRAGDDVQGLVSERDIVRGLAARGASFLSQSAASAMTRKLTFCAPGDSVEQAMQAMTAGRFRHLPVRDEGRLVGMISIGDVVKSRIAETELESQSLKQWIASG